MVIFFIFFTFLSCLCKGKKVIICDLVTNITLHENDIVFIESFGFPYSFANETNLNNLTINIFPDFKGDALMSLTIGLTSGQIAYDCSLINYFETFKQINYIDSLPYLYITNSSSLTFMCQSLNNDVNYLSFQGFVSYEKNDTNGCSLTNISQPLFLGDDSEVAYIIALDYSNIFNSSNCSWNFIAPKDFGFKFTSFTNISGTTIIVKNSSDYIITDIFTQPNRPYYNVDHNITINFEKKPWSKNFAALISIVKKEPIRNLGECLTEKLPGYLTWSTSFYPNNILCNFSITILQNHQLFVSYDNVLPELEAQADTISLTIDDDIDNRIIFNTYGKSVFPASENGKTKTLYWEFISDGSVITQGFSIDFISYECKCNELLIVVPCNHEFYYSLMDIDKNLCHDEYMYYYCANMKCIFTIIINETCPEKYIVALLNLLQATPGNSVFRLISNNQTLTDLNTFDNAVGFGYIQPNSSTTFEFFSGNALETGTFIMSFQAYNKYKILPKIILTYSSPMLALRLFMLEMNSLLHIELSDELKQNNDTLKMINVGDMFLPLSLQFYTDVNLNHPLGNNISALNLASMVILILEADPHIPLIASAKKASTENCLFHESSFYIDHDYAEIFRKARFSMVSNHEGPCNMVIVSTISRFIIDTLWTTAEENQVEIFSGLNNLSKILEFNKIDASHWQSLALTSLYYVIKIPAKSSIVIESYEYSPNSGDNYDYKGILIATPCSSILETPSYGETMDYYPTYDPLVYILQNITVQFTVIDYDISKNGTLGFKDASGNIKMLNATKQSIEFFSTTVTLLFNEPEIGYKGAILYLKAFK